VGGRAAAFRGNHRRLGRPVDFGDFAFFAGEHCLNQRLFVCLPTNTGWCRCDRCWTPFTVVILRLDACGATCTFCEFAWWRLLNNWYNYVLRTDLRQAAFIHHTTPYLYLAFPPPCRCNCLLLLPVYAPPAPPTQVPLNYRRPTYGCGGLCDGSWIPACGGGRVPFRPTPPLLPPRCRPWRRFRTILAVPGLLVDVHYTILNGGARACTPPGPAHT